MQDRWALASSPRQKHPNSISCSSVCCWHILYPDYKPPLRSFIHIWFVNPSSICNPDNYDMKSKKDDIHSALLCTFNVHYGEDSAGAPADLQHSVILSVLKVLIVRFGPPTPPVQPFGICAKSTAFPGSRSEISMVMNPLSPP